MGLEHQRLRDILAGQLQGALSDLERSENELATALAERDRFRSAVDELRSLVAHHEKAPS